MGGYLALQICRRILVLGLPKFDCQRQDVASAEHGTHNRFSPIFLCLHIDLPAFATNVYAPVPVVPLASK